MRNLICILNGHKDFYETADKKHLSSICIRCKQPAYKNEQEKVSRMFQIAKFDSTENWDMTECINSCKNPEATLTTVTAFRKIGK